MSTADVLALALEDWLRLAERADRPPPDEAVRRALTFVALAAPDTTACCPHLRRLCGTTSPQVNALTGTRFDADSPGKAPLMVGVKDAAELLGISERAVRKAAANGRLTAAKHPVTAEWRIDRAAAMAYRRQCGVRNEPGGSASRAARGQAE